MALRALEFMSQINDGEENATALLAIARARPGWPEVHKAEAMARNDARVRVARALALGDLEEASKQLDALFEDKEWDADYTIRRKEFGLLVCELFDLTPKTESLKAAMGLDADLDIKLAELGGIEAPRRLTSFEVESFDPSQARAALVDPTLLGRSYVAQHARGDEEARSALEGAIETVLEGALSKDSEYLLTSQLWDCLCAGGPGRDDMVGIGMAHGRVDARVSSSPASTIFYGRRGFV